MKLPILIKLVSVFLAYFMSGKIGLALATVNASVTAVWAPTGIAIASVLLFGRKALPVIFLAAFFTNYTTAGTVLTSLGIAAGNTIEAGLASYLINLFAGGRAVFDSPRGIFKFAIIVAFSSFFSAAWGVGSLLLGGLVGASSVVAVLVTWWFGNISGAVLVTPLIVLWSSKSSFRWDSDKKLEVTILILGLVIVAGAIFNGLFLGVAQTLPLEFLCIPILTWIALRFDEKTTISSVAVLGLIAIWGTANGLGSFALYRPGESFLLLQSFMVVVAVTALTLSVIATERERVKNLFQSTLDNMREGFQIIGFNWRYLYVNDAVARQGKNSKEELLGRTMMEVYPGIEKTNFFGFLRRCMNDRIPHSMENEFVFPDGTRGWFALKMEPINEGVLILSVDISEQKEDQKELARDKAEAEALLDSIGDGIIATDPKGRIILVNNAFEEQLGFAEEELLGKNSFEKLLMEDEKSSVLSEKDWPLSKALRTGKKVTAIHYLVRKNGTKFLARVTASPILINKKIGGAIKVFHDITQEKEVDEMKNEFISLVSHELRTPLSAIKGFVSMINDGDYGKIDKSLVKPFHHITLSTDRLIKIVNEMLDVSRIEANKVELSKTLFYVDEAVIEIIETFRPLSARQGLKLVKGEIIHERVYADRDKVIEILSNLISNAIKFTEKGSVKVYMAAEKGSIVVYVKDSGVGIDKKDQQKLFNKFEQLKYKKSEGSSGAGLGLYISRELARIMGGDIWIERSEPGKGSIFALRLPLRKVGSKKEANVKVGS
jgi:PAS domain S-box-containing protein